MPRERALLVSIELDLRRRRDGVWPLEEEARELRELAASSGCQVAGEAHARRHVPMAGTFLGRGKLEELAAQVISTAAQVVIFSHELSPAQQRNIEDRVGVKTIDRTQLILDIFAQRARTQEGKLQVELAQLRYLLPRLAGKGVMLSRLGGGIGTRGPGEQKLEMDRRRIRERITRLGRDLEQVKQRRGAIRSRRRETRIPVAAMVGYTNAGKTTLLNRLTGAGATAKHQLFTTLDPLARRVRLPMPPGGIGQAGPGGAWIVLTDTVGFLHDLPHQLIDAFKATLEEAQDADVLLHVLDAADPLAAAHADAVERVLRELGLETKPRLTLLNKSDLIEDPARLQSLQQGFAPALSISAATGQGCETLLAHLGKLLLGQPAN